MLFREGCGELSERFRAWRLCIKRSRNVRASALISTATAASHSTSKGYSVTILSSMGKATSQIDGIGRRICSGRSRKTLCPLTAVTSLASRLNRVAEREKGAGRTKAGLFFELPYSCHFRCFVVAIFSLRDGPAVAILFAPEWAARWTSRTVGSHPRGDTQQSKGTRSSVGTASVARYNAPLCRASHFAAARYISATYSQLTR